MEQMISEIHQMKGVVLEKGRCLLLIFAQCWDEELLQKRIEVVKNAFAGAEICGVTHYEDYDLSDLMREAWIFSFLFFEQPSFTVRRFPFSVFWNGRYDPWIACSRKLARTQNER